jgi:hypothetical protein
VQGGALGAWTSEAPTHLWGLWCAAEGLFEHGPFVRVADIAFPDGFSSHLMDPVNLIVFAPALHLAGGGPEGAVFAWNLLHLVWFLVGLSGCVALARRLWPLEPGSGWATALFLLIFCGSPFFLRFQETGRTEYLPALLLPWHLALLHRWLGRPSPEEGLPAPPSLKVGLAAGATLAGVWLGGWYLVVFSTLLEIPFLLLWGLPLGLRAWLRRLPSLFTLPVLVLLPAALSLLLRPPDQALQSSLQEPIPLELAALAKQEFLEVLRAPRQMARFLDAPVYPGLSVLLLGLYGALRRPRGGMPYLLAGVGLLLFALGPRVTFWTGNGETSLLFPTWLLVYVIPPLRLIRAWCRLSALVALPLGLAASYGLFALMRALPAGRRRLGVPVLGLLTCGLVFVDLTSFPAWPRLPPARFDPAPPPALLRVIDALPPGALIHFPLDVAISQGESAERHGDLVLWQLAHGRPVSAGFGEPQDSTIEESYLTRLVLERQALNRGLRDTRGPGEPLPTDRLPIAMEEACARQDARRLHALGFAGIVFREDAPDAEVLGGLLVTLLGEASFSDEGFRAWRLDGVEPPEPGAAPGRCPMPRVPGKLRKSARSRL